MKKLLFIISAVLVSVMGWGAELVSADSNEGLGIPYTLNPYAYDLNSTWDEVSQQLTVHFKLNSPPNLNDGINSQEYNPQPDKEPNGLQIYAVDSEGNEYRIEGPGRSTIQKYNDAKWTLEIPLANGVTALGANSPIRDIPRGVPLTWKVRVKGRSKGAYESPRLVNATVDKQPYQMAGVAIGTNPYAKNFAKTFVANTNNGGGLQGNATYGWLYNELYDASWIVGTTNATRTPALLEYTANLKYAARHRKNYHDGNAEKDKSWFSSHAFSEPHRVRVSEDGRIFVSSYLKTAGWAVAEYVGNNRFNTIIACDITANEDKQSNLYSPAGSGFNRRAVDFDVKGSGENLKILVAWVDPKDRNVNTDYWYAKVECYEYELGKAEKNGETLPFDQIVGSSKANLKQYVTKVAEYNDYNSSSNKHGLIFQGFAGDAVSGKYTGATPYHAGEKGFIGVAYGKGDNNPIWMKVDFGIDKPYPAHILYFDNTGNNPTQAKKDLTMSTDYTSIGHYGGHALVVTEDYLITADGRHSQHLIFYSLDDLSKLSGSGAMPYRKEAKYLATTPTDGTWINGLALDYANNLYIVSAHTNKVYTFGLPYSGLKETPAPKKSEYTFMLPHLASGLEYHPYYDDVTKKGDKYKFSFNVDVANPTNVDICFYDTKDKMLKGGDDYSFRYSFPAGDYKQGAMSVVFDAVRETRFDDLSLKNTDENEYLNLPPGEYYWNVRVSRNVTIGSETHTQVDATPAPEEYCFLPERLSQGMDACVMDDATKIYGTNSLSNVAIYRPMKSSYYNTFCVPFDVESLAGTCYEGAELLEFTGVYLNNNVNGESILELQFSNSGKIVAGVPYLLKPVADINTIVPLGKEITFHYTDVENTEHYVEKKFDDNSMTYAALLQRNKIYTDDGLLYFILVDNNRLARVLNDGAMLGLRGYFMLAHELPAGTKVGIAERKPTPTSIIDLHGTQVDVEKFMREGRVYIRVGESLYTLSGEKVE